MLLPGQSRLLLQRRRSILCAINMRRDVFSFALSVVSFFLSNPDTCRAQWTKDINCPAGTVYRDLRPDAGRQEFCERLLPGSLKVKDGPFRFWFSEGYPGDEGAYKNGRQVGPWKECSRFGNAGAWSMNWHFPTKRIERVSDARCRSPFNTKSTFSISLHVGVPG